MFWKRKWNRNSQARKNSYVSGLEEFFDRLYEIWARCFWQVLDLPETHCGESSGGKTSYKHLIFSCAHCWRWFRVVISHRGRKNAISVFLHSSTQGGPIKILLYIGFDTPTPSVADVKAQWAYFKGADSTRVPRFCTFYFLAVLYFDVSFSDFTWWTGMKLQSFWHVLASCAQSGPKIGPKTAFLGFLVKYQ